MRRIFLFGIGLILPIAMFAQGALMAGAIKNAKDTLYTNGTPNAVEEETPASGGDGNYSYRWVISGMYSPRFHHQTLQPSRLQ